MRKLLITGFGGFIGYNLVQSLKDKFAVTALDNFSNISNYSIKLARAAQLGIADFESFKKNGGYHSGNSTFYYADLCDSAGLEKIFATEKFDLIVNLAALTGIRQSLLNPAAYIDSNIKGFINVLECAKKFDVKKIIYSSSSSVYGANDETPYNEAQRTDNPISVYAASKKADELLASTYAHLYGLEITGLRFFTVYGPWTRPDMAAYIFMKAIEEQQPISLFNEGKMIRDFTYVDDAVKAIKLLAEKMENDHSPGSNLFNVGNHKPIYTLDFLNAIEKAMQKKAIVGFKSVQPGDMMATNASCHKLYDFTGFRPETSVREGVEKMVDWFNSLDPTLRKSF